VQQTPMRGPGTTILVVDDDALITLNTADILNERGHKVLEAFSAQEALSLIEQHPDIGVLITDFGMPGMNGLELAEVARRHKPDLPILLTSGYAELPDHNGIAFARLEKPFHEEELLASLNQLLGSTAVE
jgi:Response regulator containing CheY-like receiver, AAA-type ATPase, and DNA-binding domains